MDEKCEPLLIGQDDSYICWLKSEGKSNLALSILKLFRHPPWHMPIKTVEKDIVGDVISPYPGDIFISGTGMVSHIGIIAGGYNGREDTTYLKIIHCYSGGCGEHYMEHGKGSGIVSIFHYIGPKAKDVRKRVMEHARILMKKIVWTVSSVCSYVLGACKETNNETLMAYSKEITQAIEKLPSDQKIKGICSIIVLLAYLFAFAELRFDIPTYFPLNPNKCIPYTIGKNLPKKYWRSFTIGGWNKGKFYNIDKEYSGKPIFINIHN